MGAWGGGMCPVCGEQTGSSQKKEAEVPQWVKNGAPAKLAPRQTPASVVGLFQGSCMPSGVTMGLPGSA